MDRGQRTALLSIVLVLLAMTSAIACDTDDNEAKTQVSGTLGDFFLRVEPATAPAGAVVFNVTNTSQQKHEFVVLKTDTPEDKLPIKDNKVDEQGKVGEIEEFSGPNVNKQLTEDLKSGHYVLICNLPGHYQQGIHTTFIVQ